MDIRYTARFFRNADEDRYDPDPFEVTPRFPETGTVAGADVTLRYSDARSYAWSISPEEGRNFRIGLSADDEALGSDYHTTAVTFAWEEYIGNPWLANHVLALNVEGGVTQGNLDRRSRFGIGGIPDRDIVQDLLQLTFIGGTGLRGYPPGVAVGDRYVLLNAEYRFPLRELMQGFLSLPLYFANLHAAAFADWGAATSRPLRLADFRLGVGGELRQAIWLGYAQPLTLRLGYARGVDEGGTDDVFLIFGSSF
jgi:hemolysin activation/secretion protein